MRAWTGILLLLVSTAAPAAADKCAHPIWAATYNLLNMKLQYAQEKFPPWRERKEAIVKWVRENKVQILGTQEGMEPMYGDLLKALPGFRAEGVARSKNPENGEFSKILFDTKRFDSVRGGTFWLSPTPDVAESVGWDADLTRVCTWVQLKDKTTGKRLYVFNTHFDHKGVEARRSSARLLVKKIKEIAGDEPVLLLGDLNAEESDGAIQTLRESLRLARASVKPEGPEGSFQDGRRIDHIFTSKDLKVCRYKIMNPRTAKDGPPSDHFPVLVEISR